MQPATFFVLPLLCSALLFSNSRERISQNVPFSYWLIDTTPPQPIAQAADTVLHKVEIEASFPGDLSGWQQYLVGNLNPNTPVLKGAPAGTYTVVVQFIVSKDGSVSSIKPLTSMVMEWKLK